MELHDDRPMKLGLYFPLLQGWREWECLEPVDSTRSQHSRDLPLNCSINNNVH